MHPIFDEIIEHVSPGKHWSDDQVLREWRELIREGRVVLIGPVRQEILSGIRHVQEFERLQVAMRARNDAAWQIKLLTDQAREHAAREEYVTAANLLRRAATYAPTDGSIPLAAGALLMKAGKFEDAIPLLKNALERGATGAQRYLAEASAAIGRTEVSR